MNVMKDKIFVDSNIWIYLFTSDNVSKNDLVRKFIAESITKENIFQTINFYNHGNY